MILSTEKSGEIEAQEKVAFHHMTLIKVIDQIHGSHNFPHAYR